MHRLFISLSPYSIIQRANYFWSVISKKFKIFSSGLVFLEIGILVAKKIFGRFSGGKMGDSEKMNSEKWIWKNGWRKIGNGNFVCGVLGDGGIGGRKYGGGEMVGYEIYMLRLMDIIRWFYKITGHYIKSPSVLEDVWNQVKFYTLTGNSIESPTYLGNWGVLLQNATNAIWKNLVFQQEQSYKMSQN